MRLAPEQVIALARLSGQWLDCPDDARSGWLSASLREHPDLAQALLAMTGKRPEGAPTGADPLSLPAIGAAESADLAGHRAGDLVGHYRLISLLGRGGMGEVWLAEQADGRMSRRLAVKLPLPDRAQGNWRRRFERERDILAALDHPGIAKLFDAGVAADGQPFLAMQYVVGMSLTQHAQTHGLDLEQRARLFVELLDVVQHAHAALVAHRDLKPSNIMVDERGRVMLLDFGVAKLMAESGPQPAGDLTQLPGVALTLDYASPEQVAGRPMGTGTDIYSLGVVLYELLAGQRPYRLRRASRAAMEEAILEQELTPPSGRVSPRHAESMALSRRTLKRRLSGDLDSIVLKALRKKSDERYATAQAFGDDLKRWLRREPVSAQPDSLSYRLQRAMARNWRWAAGGATIGAALLGATLVASMRASEAREASRSARGEARHAEAVTKFMRDLLVNNGVRQADPTAARKRTAEQLLDDAASRIGVELADAPEQQIALMNKMADMYVEMRLPDRARAVSRQAADLAVRFYGPDRIEAKSAEAYWMLVSAAVGHGEVFDAASQPLLRAVPALARSSNEEERRLALVLCYAVMERDFELRPEAALAYAELAERAVRDDRDSTAMDTHHIIGVVYFQNLRLADAARQFEITRKLQAAHGVEAQYAESVPTWRGRLQELVGNYAQAESLMRMGIAMERQNDPGGGRANDWGRADYARFLVDTGRPAEALALSTVGAAATDTTPLLNPRRTFTAQAHALVRLGRSEEALAKAEQADRMHRSETDDSVRTPLAVLAEALLSAGRVGQAIAMLDREEPRLAQARASIVGRLLSEYRVRALIASARPREARAYLDSRRSVLAPPGCGPADRARLAWLDAGVALLEGRAPEARRVLDDGVRHLEQTGPDARIYLREWQARLSDRIGDAELALGHAEAARSAYEAALLSYGEVVDPAYSMPMGRVALRLAELARRFGDAPAARRLRAQSDAIAARHPGQQGWGA